MSRIMHELKPSSHKQSSINKPAFKGYQNHHVPNSAKGVSNKRGSSLAMGLLLILVPSLLVGGVLAYQSYSQQQVLANQPVSLVQPESKIQPELETQRIETRTQTEATAVEADEALFAVRVAPTSKTLKVLPRQEVYAPIELESTNVAADTAVVMANTNSTTQTTASAESGRAQPTVQSSMTGESNELQSDSDLLKGLDFSELPPELALKLESIMGEQQSAPEPMDSRPAGKTGSQVIELETHTNSLSGVLPKLDLQTHMYSSSETKRWVKVNGQEVAQGEWIGQEIQLLEVKPQSVIIEFNQQKIEIPALYEWQG
ncbi:general secretion pathway protein GspB [Vibrio kanaloae]|uniref:general secretion pathway protein GspB n=1 Tax=Vibrio kanaloae TaxID=170673 RepID=UPI0010BD7FE2|nr:general secretion pathway protein GspB [Vibrio kanaloae]MCG9556558.1 general secretion pathway protein GspB [Vibrio kanaloae]TKF03999.1 general secretion pathway protein GspA [Vibrio kanaloae]TKF65107.1 general secretion pathway protein GspA [Vibrio kanaloae]